MKIHVSQIDRYEEESTRVSIPRQHSGAAKHPRGLSKSEKQKLQTCRKVRPTESRLQS